MSGNKIKHQFLIFGKILEIVEKNCLKIKRDHKSHQNRGLDLLGLDFGEFHHKESQQKREAMQHDRVILPLIMKVLIRDLGSALRIQHIDILIEHIVNFEHGLGHGFEGLHSLVMNHEFDLITPLVIRMQIPQNLAVAFGYLPGSVLAIDVQDSVVLEVVVQELGDGEGDEADVEEQAEDVSEGEEQLGFVFDFFGGFGHAVAV